MKKLYIYKLQNGGTATYAEDELPYDMILENPGIYDEDSDPYNRSTYFNPNVNIDNSSIREDVGDGSLFGMTQSGSGSSTTGYWKKYGIDPDKFKNMYNTLRKYQKDKNPYHTFFCTYLALKERPKSLYAWGKEFYKDVDGWAREVARRTKAYNVSNLYEAARDFCMMNAYLTYYPKFIFTGHNESLNYASLLLGVNLGNVLNYDPSKIRTSYLQGRAVLNDTYYNSTEDPTKRSAKLALRMTTPVSKTVKKTPLPSRSSYTRKR